MNRATLATLMIAAALVACESSQRPPVDTDNTPYAQYPDMGPRPDGAPADTDGGEVDPEDRVDGGEVDAALLADVLPDAAQFEQVPYDVETRVGERHTPAGLENRITCQVLDQRGYPISGHRTVAEIHPDSGFERTETGVIGHIARDYQVICAAPALGLRDDTPAIWTVAVARTARVAATVSDTDLQAGDDTTVLCHAFDAYGNATSTEAATLDITPPAPGLVRLPEGTLRFVSTGVYGVTCSIPGAESAPPIPVQVRSGLPAHLAARLVPEKPVYAVDSVVELAPIVTDEHDNPVVSAALEFAADPVVPTFGVGRFQPDREGRFTLSARVLGPTLGDRELQVEQEIFVDRGGPGIRCERPDQGEQILRPASGHMVIQGQIADASALQAVRVDGQEVEIDAGGRWRADLPVLWGLNAHEVVAIDEHGNENSTVCHFLAADAYLDEARPVADAAILRMAQGALDDGEPDNPLGSLADVLRRIVNAPGMRDAVHQAAAAQNPIVRSECHSRVLGVCLFRLGVEYRDLSIGGRNSLGLTLVDGGLRTAVTIRNIEVVARAEGTIDTTAHIRADHMTIDLTFSVGRRHDGNPAVSVRSINNVEVGDLHSDFSGFITGAIFELVFWAFEGLIRNTIADTIRDFLANNINSALTDLLSNIDVGSITQAVDIPNLVGGDSIHVEVTASISTIDFRPGEAIIGVETQVNAPARLAGPSMGVPLPPGSNALQMPGDRTAGAAVQITVLNQAMHRLWRAGYFDATVDGLVDRVASDLPDGVQVRLSLPQAPSAVGLDGETTIRAFLGPVRAEIIYPGFFAEPFGLMMSAALDATVELVGAQDVAFENVRLVELNLGFAGAQVAADARQIIEDTLAEVTQGLMDRALNDGLPSLPVPEFVIPPSLAPFGLAPGTRLGLRNLRLTGRPAHWILDGNFGQ